MVRPSYLVCPACEIVGLQPLCLIHQRGVPHGQEHHQTVYDHQILSHCSQCGHGQLESYSHDCWSYDEEWDMYWCYLLPPADVVALQGLLRDGCPTPLNGECPCALHDSLRRSAERIHTGVMHSPLMGGTPKATPIRLLQEQGGPRLLAAPGAGLRGEVGLA